MYDTGKRGSGSRCPTLGTAHSRLVQGSHVQGATQDVATDHLHYCHLSTG